MRKQANNFSHLTAIDRIKLSSPVQFLLSKNLLSGRILDFGCGLGTDVNFSQQKGLDILATIHIIIPHILRANLIRSFVVMS